MASKALWSFKDHYFDIIQRDMSVFDKNSNLIQNNCWKKIPHLYGSTFEIGSSFTPLRCKHKLLFIAMK